MAKAQSDTLPFPILIGDIGGTNARFSILADAETKATDFVHVQTADYKTIDDAIVEKVINNPDLPNPRSAILAIAGPVDGDEIDLTNCDWIVRPKKMIGELGFDAVLVLNDFEAQALAVATLTDGDREAIGAPLPAVDATRVVLGPGTGLGVAGLLHAHDTWFPVPGEGGHVDIGPRSARDLEIFPHLVTIEGRVSAEEIISGRGLLHIYNAVCAAGGITPVIKSPADVTEQGLGGKNGQAAEALELFVTYLGRLAGDLALIFMARGGVFLGGGISPKILPELKKPFFRAAFEDKAPHKELMKTIPTFVVTHPQAALAGLASYARAPDAYGIATEGRCWRR
jgi:glucokinase